MTLWLASIISLLPDPHRIGSLGLDVNTRVYRGAGMILGFQVVAFTFIASFFVGILELPHKS